MKELSKVLKNKKTLRCIGFDDAPFDSPRGSKVNIAGIVCAGTQFEGMLWGETQKDGTNATEALIDLFKNSKFYQQVHVVLTDGIAVGGFNILDLSTLSQVLERPCIAFMRKHPDLKAIDNALKNFDDYELRKTRIEKAGEIYHYGQQYFQVSGCEPEVAAQVLQQLTKDGHVPEAIRLAHLIGSAVMTGQSSKRA